MKKKCSAGFTLIEMAVVLVIIGVITGGIIMAQSLIQTAKLQTVITDYNNYVTAASNFKLTYKNLPGDYLNATTLWGTDSVGCPAGGGTSGTCNGNGDGQITNTNSTGQVGESYLFWQHLHLANMFSQALGNQSGNINSNDALQGSNSPFGSIKGSLFTPLWLGTNGGTACSSNCFPGFYGNVILFSARESAGVPANGNNNYVAQSAFTMAASPVLFAAQAAAIDTKIDDGLPGTGNVRAFIGGSNFTPLCATTNSASTALYNFSNNVATLNAQGATQVVNSAICSLIFITGL